MAWSLRNSISAAAARQVDGRLEDVVGARPAGRTTDTRISTNINYSTTSPVSVSAGSPKEWGQPVAHHQSQSVTSLGSRPLWTNANFVSQSNGNGPVFLIWSCEWTSSPQPSRSCMGVTCSVWFPWRVSSCIVSSTLSWRLRYAVLLRIHHHCCTSFIVS